MAERHRQIARLASIRLLCSSCIT
uniref:Uncharacterized protein n=1 Tax=Nelumbo nucifera TaxID=4432 RepID=A0A822YSZ6_NELNU|nr:TPA_asm: hypothetical protein HUJ06_006412 [Nelumbo nucifera]